MPVNQLFEIYLDGTIHVTSATLLQKACEQRCLYLLLTPTIALFSWKDGRTFRESCLAHLWAHRVTLGINKTLHCWHCCLNQYFLHSNAMEVSQTLFLFFLSLLIYIENKNENNALLLVFHPSAVLKHLWQYSYSLQSSGSVDILTFFAADTLQLCQGWLGIISRYFSGLLRTVWTGSSQSHGCAVWGLHSRSDFHEVYFSTLLYSAFPGPWPVSISQLLWPLAFRDVLPSVHRLSTAHHWAHGHIPYWNPFPQIGQFRQTVGSEKSSGCPKRLPFQNERGYGDLGNLQCSRNVFVASLPGYSRVSEL